MFSNLCKFGHKGLKCHYQLHTRVNRKFFKLSTAIDDLIMQQVIHMLINYYLTV